jgi:rfaE bifunctional protein nucleotidyltransferase chain/domain|tara:strand:+ start:372 stop:776 length:405 start_codon:yes stop_codon:yes gene_type:complete
MICVWVNGCFDVLHRGHFELFRHAKSLGERLVVGIDADEKVRADKGKNRPVNNQEDRKFALESIKYIDEVIIFNTKQDLENTIREIEPSIMVIGSDWKGKDVIGQEYVKEIIFYSRIGNYSTTNILNHEKRRKK